MKRKQYAVSALICAGLLIVSSKVLAQTSGSAGYGGIGDPASAPGSPSSSYALNGLDQVNYYNGLVNIRIPLYTVSGRGSAAVPVAPAVQRQWTVDPTFRSPQSNVNLPWLGFFGIATSAPDLVYSVTVAANPNACNVNNSLQSTGPYTTYLIYAAADGTETVLRDIIYNGQPQGSNTCPPQPPSANRGQIFQSSDSTNLTFIADQNVVDGQQGTISGVLIKRDGTRYRIAPQPPYFGPSIVGVEDRNGNSIGFSSQLTSNPLSTSLRSKLRGRLEAGAHRQ